MSYPHDLPEVPGLGSYIKTNQSLIRERIEAFRESNRIIEDYKEVLNDTDICKAKGLYWGCNSPEEYRHKFLVLVLMEAYRVWDKSHMRYEVLLKAIEQKDPQWKVRFENEHERKLRRCKGTIYTGEEVPL